MSADKLSENLWPGDIHIKNKSEETPDERIKDALQKALDATTPERAGTPWDKKKGENEQRRNWFLIQGD